MAKDFIVRFRPLPKQFEAWSVLADDKTTELLFGGAAGGSKTYLGCAWQIIRRVAYPGTRGLIGRAVLKILKQTTLQTFFEVAKRLGLEPDVHFKYNAQDSIITFSNDSFIFLKDLAYQPSDPEYQELGSLEITDAFIDEAAEITQKCFNIVNSRIRYKLDDFKLVPKILLTCNPSKNWLYHEFYKKDKDGKMPVYRKFIQSFATDNKYLSKHYIENLKKLDRISYLRLYKGDWEYSDDRLALFNYDSILDLFTNTIKQKENPGKYITCDAARLGKDKTTIFIWEGWHVKKIIVIKKSTNDVIEKQIEKICENENIPRSHVIVDEIGVGSGVVDHLHCKGFIASASPIQPRMAKYDPLKKVMYQNLKTQCIFMLADKVNKGEVSIHCDNIDVRNTIVEELEIVKQVDADKDGKLKITKKDDIKNIIGRSPDFLDGLSFRCYFELKKPTGFRAVKL